VPCGSREEYAAIRRDELIEALSLAGIPFSRIQFFDVPDQETASRLAESARALAKLITTCGADLVVTTPYEGGHPDHDSAAFIAASAVEIVGLLHGYSPPLFEMTSYHLAGDKVCAGRFNSGCEVYEHVLTPYERALKRQMFRVYASQRRMLSSFGVDCERFRDAPSYDFTSVPNNGLICYEALGWPHKAGAWCDAASAALDELRTP
jgi:LmbE family N-acetylglucosaminyl deacetylase